MSNNPELDARCDYALYLVLGASHEHCRQRALQTAERCGYAAYPAERVSAFFLNEPELLAAYRKGWDGAYEENRPRTREELAAIIEKKDQGASRGCGQFYELYAQNFTYAIDRWLPTLREGELDIVMDLLKTRCYEPNAGGYWEYDAEENDVIFVNNDE